MVVMLCIASRGTSDLEFPVPVITLAFCGKNRYKGGTVGSSVLGAGSNSPSIQF